MIEERKICPLILKIGERKIGERNLCPLKRKEGAKNINEIPGERGPKR